MVNHVPHATYTGVLIYVNNLGRPTISDHDIDRIRNLVYDGYAMREIIDLALPIEPLEVVRGWINRMEYIGADGWGKYVDEYMHITEVQAERSKVEGKLWKAERQNKILDKALKHADKHIEEISAVNNELVSLLIDADSEQSSRVDVSDAARLDTLMHDLDDMIVQLNHLRTESNASTSLRGGMGGQLEDEEHVYSYAPYHNWDEPEPCGVRECFGYQSDRKIQQLREKIAELEEQIRECEEEKKIELDPTRARIFGEGEKQCERQSAGSMFVNADEEVGDELLHQCECETIEDESIHDGRYLHKLPPMSRDTEHRPSIRGGSGSSVCSSEAYTIDSNDEYDQLIRATVEACTPEPPSPCFKACHKLARVLQLKNRYLEHQLEKLSEMHDSAVQDLSWNINMLRVLEEENQELKEERDEALLEVGELKRSLEKSKERGQDEVLGSCAYQGPYDGSTYQPSPLVVQTPDSKPWATSFNFYPSRSVIIVPGAPAQILKFPQGTTLHDIQDALNTAYWTDEGIDQCGLNIQHILHARSKMGIELPESLPDEVVVIGLPPDLAQQLGEGRSVKRSLSRFAGKALRDEKMEADKIVKIAAWETVDGDDYVEFIPRTQHTYKGKERCNDSTSSAESRSACLTESNPEPSYIHEADSKPVSQPRGWYCSHCDSSPVPPPTRSASRYAPSLIFRGGGGDSEDEEHNEDYDNGGRYFVLDPDDEDDVDHEDDPPTRETKYKNNPYEDLIVDWEWEQKISWCQVGVEDLEEQEDVCLRGGDSDGVYGHEEPICDEDWQTEWEQHIGHRAVVTNAFTSLTAGPREALPPRFRQSRTPDGVRRANAIRLANYKRGIDKPDVRRCYRDACGCEYSCSAAVCSCSPKQVLVCRI